MTTEMNNPFDLFSCQIIELQAFVSEQGMVGQASFMNTMFGCLTDNLADIRTTYLAEQIDATTETVLNALAMGWAVTDADLEHAAKRLLTNVDMSDRNEVIDRLRSYEL